MIYYSDKAQTLVRGRDYIVNGNRVTYLGMIHIDGGREAQYRFVSPSGYSNKTASELDQANVVAQ